MRELHGSEHKWYGQISPHHKNCLDNSFWILNLISECWNLGEATTQSWGRGQKCVLFHSYGQELQQNQQPEPQIDSFVCEHKANQLMLSFTCNCYNSNIYLSVWAKVKMTSDRGCYLSILTSSPANMWKYFEGQRHVNALRIMFWHLYYFIAVKTSEIKQELIWRNCYSCTIIA